MELSKRLQALVDLAEPGRTAADVGCDHGYVSIYLAEHHIFDHVIAMDVRKGPLQSAEKNIRRFGLEGLVETRLSDGLQELSAGEADAVFCAGMGGELMVRILSQGMPVAASMKQMLLQPQSEIGKVRKFLRENGFRIVAEDMVCEDGKYYPMMRAVNIDVRRYALSENTDAGITDRQLAVSADKDSGKTSIGGEAHPQVLGEQHMDDWISADRRLCVGMEEKCSPASGRYKQGGWDIAADDVAPEALLQHVLDAYGPCLLRQKNEVLHQFLQKEKKLTEDLLDRLKESLEGQAASERRLRQQERYEELKQKYAQIGAALSYYMEDENRII